MDEKIFKTILVAKLDLIKTSLENAKADQKNIIKRQDLIDQVGNILVQAIIIA